MYNWRLLLLAFVAALHPIASFTERNFVDGREQCCEHRLLRDTRLDGTFRFSKPDDRRLNDRAETRNRRYEVREDDPVLTRSDDRRLTEIRSEREVSRISPEFPARFARTQIYRLRETSAPQRDRTSPAEAKQQRTRNTEIISNRDNRDHINRDERNREITRERFVRVSDILQNDRDNRGTSLSRFSRDDSRFVRLSRDDRRFTLLRDNLPEREMQRSRENSGELRRIQPFRETRNILQRTRNDVTRSEMPGQREDRRIVRIRMDDRRAFTTRSESRFDNNKDRRSLDRRETLNEFSDVTSKSRSADRIRDMRQETRNGRDAQKHTVARRAIFDSEASKDLRVRRESSEESRLARDSTDRSRNDVRSGNSERYIIISINYRKFSSESDLVREMREARRNSRVVREDHQRFTTRQEFQTTASRNPMLRLESYKRVSEERRFARETSKRSANEARTQHHVLSLNGRRLASLSRSADRVREMRELSRLDNRESQRTITKRVVVEKATIRDSRVYRDNSQRASDGRRLARETNDRSRNEIRDVRFDAAVRREIHNDDGHSRNIRDERRVSDTRRGESRMVFREIAHVREHEVLNHAEYRTADRLMRSTRPDARHIRRIDIGHDKLASNSRTETRNMRDMEQRDLDSRFRSNAEAIRSRVYFDSVLRKKIPFEHQSVGLNWQHIFYTLQGIYLCGILIQMMTNKGVDKNKSR